MPKQNLKWFHYKRGGVYYSRLYSAIIGYKNFYSKYFGIPFGICIYYQNDHHLDWLIERKWTLRLGNYLLSALIKNNLIGKNFRDNWKINFKKSINLANKIFFKTDLKNLSDSELNQLYTLLFDVMCNFHALSGIGGDSLDEAIFLIIRKDLKKKLKDGKNFEKIYTVFTTPETPTFIQKKDLAIMRLAQKTKKVTNLKFPKWNIEINKIVQEYWWTTLGWSSSNRLTIDVIKKEIRSYLKNKDLNQSLLKIKNFSEKIRAQKEEILREIPSNKNKNLKDLLFVFEELAIYRDRRKQTQIHFFAAQELIFQEIIRRKPGLKFNEIVWLTFEEVLQYLSSFKTTQELSNLVKKRKNHTINYIKGDYKFIIMEGQKAAKLKKSLIEEKIYQKVKYIKGIPASLGKARGIVRVFNDPNYLNEKLQKGEILVSSQTTPDFVPAMKKAAAIIADEGGATCHAAIISRELGIPCIVGTKIATQVLKDGNIVEVDANKGIVRVIK